MDQGHLRITEFNRNVKKIEFHHPAHNALPGTLLEQLEQAIVDLEQDPQVVAAMLCSSGDRTFCAGANFEELVAVHDDASGLAFFSGFAKVINACRRSTKLIIGRVQGKAIGGGVGLAAATDYCFATQAAAIRLSELAIGIGPFVIGPAVERRIGKTAFIRMALRPEQWFTADWASSQGLYQETHPSIATMDEAIGTYLNLLSGYHPEAISELKRIFWEGTEGWDELLLNRARISGQLVQSPFTKNAIQAIRNKS
ncbi:MAG: enoyl-CoA hydratase/isomerase family protein [Saprospiraceae bacterium]|nr:enoyl-CoA hydratase/isomerase family protein [Saprospiraceae bacterium]